MSAFAEPTEGMSGQPSLFEVDRDDCYSGSIDEEIQLTQSLGAFARLHDDRYFNKGGDRHEPEIGGLKGFVEGATLGFVLENGHKSRRIDDHQLGNPSSS